MKGKNTLRKENEIVVDSIGWRRCNGVGWGAGEREGGGEGSEWEARREVHTTASLTMLGFPPWSSEAKMEFEQLGAKDGRD